LTYFLKCKIVFMFFETILTIPRELEYPKGLLKLAKRHKDEKTQQATNIATILECYLQSKGWASTRITGARHCNWQLRSIMDDKNSCRHKCFFVSNGNRNCSKVRDYAFYLVLKIKNYKTIYGTIII